MSLVIEKKNLETMRVEVLLQIHRKKSSNPQFWEDELQSINARLSEIEIQLALSKT